MTTVNLRVNVTFDDETLERLTTIAKYKRKSLSALARDYVQKGIDEEEDKFLSALAKQRYDEDTKWVNHDEFWAKVLQD